MVLTQQYIYRFKWKIVTTMKPVRTSGLLLNRNYWSLIPFFQFGEITHPGRGNSLTGEIPNTRRIIPE